MLNAILGDRSLEQLVNVATLAGIRKYALPMPDVHEGYGFPIGGVAASDREHGVISPGGIGYDINCGVRLLKSDRTRRRSALSRSCVSSVRPPETQEVDERSGDCRPGRARTHVAMRRMA